MKTLVAISAALALACTAFAVRQEREQEPYGKQEKGLKVLKPQQADWKQAENFPQGVMMYKAAESAKHGGGVWLFKFPAGTKVPPMACTSGVVVHVHQGKLEIGESGKPMEGKGHVVESGGLVKVHAGTPHWVIAHSETLVLICSDGPMETKMMDGAGQQRP